jgi:hypothetical protein
MKLSNETLSVLKNFSTINPSIEFKTGKKLSTISANKSVMAQAEISDDFPDSFCVEDLNEFLSVHSLFKDKAELNFDEQHIIFQNGRSKLKYRKTAKNMIVTPPDKVLTLPTSDVSFTLSSEDLDWILKTASVLKSPNIAIQSNGDAVEISTFDTSTDAAHDNSLQIGDGNGSQYKIVFHTESFKLVPGTYDVVICFKGIAHFKNSKDNIQYWIAFEEKNSKIGA